MASTPSSRSNENLFSSMRQQAASKKAQKTQGTRKRVSKRVQVLVSKVRHIDPTKLEHVRLQLGRMGLPPHVTVDDEVVGSVYVCEGIGHLVFAFDGFGRDSHQASKFLGMLHTCVMWLLRDHTEFRTQTEAYLQGVFPDITSKGMEMLCTSHLPQLTAEDEKKSYPLWRQLMGLPDDWLDAWLNISYSIARSYACGTKVGEGLK